MSEEQLAAAEEAIARGEDPALIEIESASAPRRRPAPPDQRDAPIVVESEKRRRPAEADSQLLTAVPNDKRHFGRYLLLCRFAQGGMADVLLATIPGAAGFEKLVAIKRVHEHLSESLEFTQMFLDEARIAARISHPNVVQVIELGRFAGTYFLAMEYVAGPSLRSLAKRTRLPLPMAARIISQVAAGLHAAHELRDEQGEPLCVVHRDVSPGNVLISSEGAVKIADFGVARARSNVHTTAAGTVKGKFAYMAPEQATAREVDHRTDVFALGVVLFEITTNHRLFKAHSDADTIAKVLEAPIPPPSKLAAGYPAELEAIVLRALQRDPERRYQTAHEMHADLEEFVHTSTGAVLPTAIGAIVKRAFADEIAAREELILRCKSELAAALGDYDDVFDSPSYSLDGTASAGAAQTRRRRGRNLAIAIAGIGAMALGAVLALLFLRGSPSGEPTQPAQHRVNLSVEATPANATVFIDGRELSNPAKWATERSQRKATVVVSAPGYRTRRIAVPLSSDGQLMIVLEPQPASPRPAADAKPARAQ